MNIVIDSNILFSALIKNSLTRKLILEYEGYFLFPGFIFNEMEKHKDELMKKCGMLRSDFNKLFQQILNKVVVVPSKVLTQYREEAVRIVKEIDIDDALFIACALAYPNSVLWSDDKKLKKQSEVKIFNTNEIKSIIEK
ncbi:MAG: PIN domain-containing protein [Nanoarchaeota archaeon]|nr:PIN domain-containing protein [Nanoarchaeota archaeon]